MQLLWSQAGEEMHVAMSLRIPQSVLFGGPKPSILGVTVFQVSLVTSLANCQPPTAANR